MFVERILFLFFFFHLVNCQIQRNLYLTDWISKDENIVHDCLRVPVPTKKESDSYQMISYCMGEFSSKFAIKETDLDQKFTFDQLSKANITNEQLYLWSAPIDLIERYQFYLNQLQNSEKPAMETEIFHNCTYPYFGPQCQYVFYDLKSSYLLFNEMISDYYYSNRYVPTLLTCYIHLECNRGPFPSCLDWSEICDGKIDCLDGGEDEEHCWQLEIHQCQKNEYQCSNGQCIPKAFYRDDSNVPDCLDQSDEFLRYKLSNSDQSNSFDSSFSYEDVICTKFYTYYYDMDISISSCVSERENLLLQALFSIKPKWLWNECWSAMKCLMRMPIVRDKICEELCFEEVCDRIIEETCPDVIIVPARPVLFGHVYAAYEKNQTKTIAFGPMWPQYVCCNHQFSHLPIDDITLPLLNNSPCRYLLQNPGYSIYRRSGQWNFFIKYTFLSLWRFQPLFSNDSKLCHRSQMYQCINSSKCISKSRLYDGIGDCFYLEDEGMLSNEDNTKIFLFNKTCSTEENLNYFKCVNTKECIPYNLVQDGKCDCTEFDQVFCDDEHFDISYARYTISFQTICDGWNHLLPQMIEGQNETDETNCEHWPLIHIYNRCDGFWHILNGSDELNCYSPPLLNCSANHHICISSETNQLICLPLEKANDGNIDCLGAADEPRKCPMSLDDTYLLTFYCNQSNSYTCLESSKICNNNQDCKNNEDEQACQNGDLPAPTIDHGICIEKYEVFGSDVAKILCRHFLHNDRRWRVYFTLDQSENLIEQNIKHENTLSYRSINQTIKYYQQRCHRGLDLQVWLDKEKNLTRHVCLCPPSYYGDICQYQNQRISLTLQFHVTSDSIQIPFLIIISLIDDTDERIIHSHEQLTYFPMINCRRKFHIYLLYSTRPKNEMKEYSIHIDIYEKVTLNHRASFIKSLNYSFLPVHRLVFQMAIPSIRDILESCSDKQCINGKCIKYYNDSNNRRFCQCAKGWSGRYCTIKHFCTCSADSLCLGKLANNRSLCLCPLNRMGSRCLITDPICHNNHTTRCLNNGQCISVDEYGISGKRFICICPRSFTGDQCEQVRTKLIVSFEKNILLPSSIFLHFIEVKFRSPPGRTTTFKSTLTGQNSIIIYWSIPFHIAFAELSNKTYYLILMQEKSKPSSIIEKKINSSDRCLDIKEFFNETMANSSFLLRRIKSYHLLCQQNSSQLSCFYDERHLCLCQKSLANCFEFDHHINLNCSGQSGCENGGQCFEENSPCPRVTICICPICYYGRRCQFSTNGYSLSLDAILAYHIIPNTTFPHQPRAVVISSIFSCLLIVGGLINGILSLMTFQNSVTREYGCGIYLLTSSIIVLFTMMIYLFKFVVLLSSQMGSIENRLFLKVQCHSIDFLLLSCVTIDRWLTAFVACERAFIIIKGIHFDQKKSRCTAKWSISLLILLIIMTNIFDPIYRSLFEENEDDDDEKRIWCIVKYPSTIRIVHLIINVIHIVIPFLINIISAIIIILLTTRQQVAIQKKQKYQEILNKQIEKHRNLLIAPCVLIILAIPRLIISFASGCMKSASDSWLFLLGYFLSLIPSLLTFILFVLPSMAYKEAFQTTLRQYRMMITRRS